MCCFTGAVRSVAGTRIFARDAGDGRQLLAYAMTVDAADPVAMVLPLRIAANGPGEALQFVDLEGYPDLFADLDLGFPAPRKVRLIATKSAPPQNLLAVVEVGAFVASFVPTVGDFERLDPRFRMPEAVWDALPTYRGFGFAVFALEPGRRTVHPMALWFRRAGAGLFFPTLHVHDGAVHERARFDHLLYCQEAPGQRLRLGAWEESRRSARSFVDLERAAGLVDADAHVYRLAMVGDHPNADVLLS
jgi:hypothetical protein